MTVEQPDYIAYVGAIGGSLFGLWGGVIGLTVGTKRITLSGRWFYFFAILPALAFLAGITLLMIGLIRFQSQQEGLNEWRFCWIFLTAIGLWAGIQLLFFRKLCRKREAANATLEREQA